MPLQHTARAGIDGDINLNFEAGLATGVGSKRGDCELIVSFPSGFAPLVDPIRQRSYPNNRDYVGLLHTAAFLLVMESHPALRSGGGITTTLTPRPANRRHGIRLIPWPSLGLSLESR
jgi:hypothetical protein